MSRPPAPAVPPRGVVLAIALIAPLLAGALGALHLQLPHHLPPGQPERHRSGPDHLRHRRRASFIGEYIGRVRAGGYVAVSNILKDAFTGSPFPVGPPGSAGGGHACSFSYNIFVSSGHRHGSGHGLVPLPQPRRSQPARRGRVPATADAAGINVTRYKYLATVIGGGICGHRRHGVSS
ncbi:MAG: hypothetical protein ACLRWQ_01555 [Flavonifractor plautii]